MAGDGAAEGRLQHVAGGCLVGCRPVFTADGRFFFVGCGSMVQLVSVATGSAVRVLKGHTQPVTALALHPSNPLQLLSGSLDGSVRVWDFAAAKSLHTISVGKPVHQLLCSGPGRVFVVSQEAADGASNKRPRQRLRRLDLPQGADKGKVGPSLCSLRGATRWALDADGVTVAAVARKKMLLHNLATEASTKLPSPARLHCVAFHPTRPLVATGDESGVIRLWHCLASEGGQGFAPMDLNAANEVADNTINNGDNGDNDGDGSGSEHGAQGPTVTTLHWHAHTVTDLCFTSDGAYLLSGGEEAVLLVWQLDTGNKRFLPRLGSPIKRLAIHERAGLYAISLEENRVRLVDPQTFKQVQELQGIKQGHGHAPGSFPGLCTHPASGAVVLPGSLGALQAYNVLADRHTLDFQVVPRNYISRTHGAKIRPTTVEQFAFGREGAFLATVECRPDTLILPDRRLKFWSFSPDSHNYVLNTCVDPPHRDTITGLACHRREPMVATCSLDRSFKLWAQQQPPAAETDGGPPGKQGIVGAVKWACLSVAGYRDLPCTALDFSPDGSLLAVACGKFVTLWDPHQCELKRVLSSPLIKRIRALCFLSRTAHLVCTSDTHILVWDLLRCKVLHAIPASVKHLAVDRRSAEFAVQTTATASGTAAVLRFQACDAEPTERVPLPQDGPNIIGLVYTRDRDEPAGQLFCLADDHSFLRVGGAAMQDTSESEGVLAPLDLGKRGAVSDAYKQIFGVAAIDLSEDAAAQQEATRQYTVVMDTHRTPSKSVFDFPTHVLPSIDLLSASFMKLLVGGGRPLPDDGDEGEEGQDDDDDDTADMLDSEEEEGEGEGEGLGTAAEAGDVGMMASDAAAAEEAGAEQAYEALEFDYGPISDFFRGGRQPVVLPAEEEEERPASPTFARKSPKGAGSKKRSARAVADDEQPSTPRAARAKQGGAGKTPKRSSKKKRT